MTRSRLPPALPANEVNDLYTAGATVLRCRWTIRPARPSSSTRSASTAAPARAPGARPRACRAAGAGLLLTALDDTVEVNDANTGDLQKLAVAAWVRLNSLPAASCASSPSGTTRLCCAHNGNLDFSLKTTDGISHSRQAGVAPQADTWYHLAGAYDGQAMRFYLNGAEVATRTSPIRSLRGIPSPGQHPGRIEPLNGNLDEVRSTAAASTRRRCRRSTGPRRSSSWPWMKPRARSSFADSHRERA